MNVVKQGDYVLGMKYHDGGPRDAWCIGFYWTLLYGDRHIILTSSGRSFRAGGFRRVVKISAQRGRFILDHTEEIESSHHTLLWWLRRKMARAPS